MKCYNCKTEIDGKFAHAIAQNICPACGKDIMSPEKIASYNGLKQLLANNFADLNAEKAANLIVANFELKQLFKKATLDEDEPEMQEPPADDSGAIKERIQRKEQEAEIKAEREKIYEDALRAQWGMEEIDTDYMIEPDEFIDMEEDTNPIVRANRMKQTQKRQQSYENMVSGGGTVRRSG